MARQGSLLYVNPVKVLITLTKVLAKDKSQIPSLSRGGIVRNRLKEARVQSYEPTDPAESGTCKAKSPGELAQHNEALDSGDSVNAAVVPFDRLRAR